MRAESGMLCANRGASTMNWETDELREGFDRVCFFVDWVCLRFVGGIRRGNFFRVKIVNARTYVDPKREFRECRHLQLKRGDLTIAAGSCEFRRRTGRWRLTCFRFSWQFYVFVISVLCLVEEAVSPGERSTQRHSTAVLCFSGMNGNPLTAFYSAPLLLLAEVS